MATINDVVLTSENWIEVTESKSTIQNIGLGYCRIAFTDESPGENVSGHILDIKGKENSVLENSVDIKTWAKLIDSKVKTVLVITEIN